MGVRWKKIHLPEKNESEVWEAQIAGHVFEGVGVLGVRHGLTSPAVGVGRSGRSDPKLRHATRGRLGWRRCVSRTGSATKLQM